MVTCRPCTTSFASSRRFSVLLLPLPRAMTLGYNRGLRVARSSARTVTNNFELYTSTHTCTPSSSKYKYIHARTHRSAATGSTNRAGTRGRPSPTASRHLPNPSRDPSERYSARPSASRADTAVFHTYVTLPLDADPSQPPFRRRPSATAASKPAGAEPASTTVTSASGSHASSARSAADPVTPSPTITYLDGGRSRHSTPSSPSGCCTAVPGRGRRRPRRGGWAGPCCSADSQGLTRTLKRWPWATKSSAGMTTTSPSPPSSSSSSSVPPPAAAAIAGGVVAVVAPSAARARQQKTSEP